MSETTTRQTTDLGWLMEMTAVGYLLSRDAHFVLYRLDDPKKPAWKRHNTLRPSISDIAAHRGPLGIYCYSLGCSTLDIDEGPPGPVVDAARQLENYVTDYPSLGGSHGPDATHLWLRDRQPRKASSKVTGFGSSFQVLSLAPPCILRGDAVVRLAEGIERADPPRRTRKTWEDPFEQLGFDWVLADKDSPRPAGRTPRKPNPVLADAVKGERNATLLASLLAAAATEVWEHLDQQSFYQELRQIAFGYSDQMADPEPARKVEGTARSVADWTWNVYRQRADPNAQRRRGIASGRARRDATMERDGRIQRHVDMGFSKPQVARSQNVSLSTVHRVSARTSAQLRAQLPMFVNEAPSGQPQGQRLKTAKRDAEARHLADKGVDVQETAHRMRTTKRTVYRALEPDKKTKRQERDAEIRKLDAEGMDKTEIARVLKVNRRTVARVLSR